MRRFPRPSPNGAPLRLARPQAAGTVAKGASFERRVALVLGGALGGWALLALGFAGRLNLAPVTLASAAAILALLVGTLMYGMRLAARADDGAIAGAGSGEMRRGLNHLHFIAALCQLLGLIGTALVAHMLAPAAE